jgi:UDP-perosamine 4-acetyltransferase
MEDIVILGSGGHCKVVLDCIYKNVIGIIDINYNKLSNNIILNKKVIGNIDALDRYSKSIKIMIAIGDNIIRNKYYNIIKNMGYEIISIKHKNSIISTFSKIGDSNFINAGAIINANCEIGNNCIINTKASIDHDSIIGNNCHICPGATIAGKVKIGDFSFIGINACIIPNVIIGKNVIIGAGSVVINNISDNCKAIGVPAKIIY